MAIEKEIEFKDCVQDGQLYFGRGLYNKALLSLQRAYMLKKDDFELNYLIGRTFYLKKDYARAKRVFADLMDIKPEDENIKLYMAYTYYYTSRPTGDLSLAENLVDGVLKINDKNINALELKADVNMFNKNYAGALTIFQEIKNGSSNIYRILFKEAICHYYLDNTAETLRLCAQLFEAGFKKNISIKKLYEAAKGRRKKDFSKGFGEMSWTQKLFAFLFDPYVDRALSLQADADRRVDYAKRELYTDKLTGVNNRACFDEVIKPELNGQGKTITLMHFDIDKFKNINDGYGHDLGDVVLVQFAKIGAEIFGKNFYRYGGEEFLAIEKGHLSQAYLTAEKFRTTVEEQLSDRVNKLKGTLLNKITCSGGLAEYPKEAAAFEPLYILTDKRLYISKENGRNMITGESLLETKQ